MGYEGLAGTHVNFSIYCMSAIQYTPLCPIQRCLVNTAVFPHSVDYVSSFDILKKNCGLYGLYNKAHLMQHGGLSWGIPALLYAHVTHTR